MATVTLFIPRVGTELCLTDDWTFPLYKEGRNETLFAALGVSPPAIAAYGEPLTSTEVTLPAGTLLQVERVYVRQGKGDFDSLTFTAQLPGAVKKKGLRPWPRFWAKLTDVNGLVAEVAA